MKEITGIMASGLDRETNLPVLSTEIFRLISKRTKNPDPFKVEKQECNRTAKPIADRVSREIMDIKDPRERLERASLASIAGNTMDFGTSGHTFDLSSFEEDYQKTLDEGLAINDSRPLARRLPEMGSVIYLADNAGEIAFDRILVRVISDLGPRLTVAVKGGPISNDATMEDANFVGMDQVSKVITTGTDHLGVNFEESPPSFLEAFRSSDLVISKGQSNFETLSFNLEKISNPIAFILKTKCAPIARSLGVNLGDNVLGLVEPE